MEAQSPSTMEMFDKITEAKEYNYPLFMTESSLGTGFMTMLSIVDHQHNIDTQLMGTNNGQTSRKTVRAD